MSRSSKGIRADKPKADDGREYHLYTRPGDIAGRCLVVGSPERATMISKMFEHGTRVADHRGLRSYTGVYGGVLVSVVTSGMGGPSIGIVLPEAVRCGARVLIRVGSCATLWREVEPRSAAICTGAVRFDGASDNWAPIEYPALMDYRVTAQLVASARALDAPYAVGIGTTTCCFNEGQARPDINDYIPQWQWERFRELVARGVLFYSMEEATLGVWCSAHGGYPCGSIDTVYANRLTNAWDPTGDEHTAEIALDAISQIGPEALLAEQPLRKPEIVPPFPESVMRKFFPPS